MVAGVDRYFQIARCFRDEDLRGDRQPEFTQLDLEMSFVDEEAVMAFVEAMAIEVSPRDDARTAPIQQVPFPRFTYDEAIERFGSDKPDLRFGMELVDLAPALAAPRAAGSGFRVFDDALAAGGRVKAIVAPGLAGSDAARDRRADRAGQALRRQGPRPPRVEAGGELKGPIAKFLSRRDASGDRRADRGQRRATSS